MYYIEPHAPLPFPSPLEANSRGLLAVGGDLSPERVFSAHCQGIFPWFNDDHHAILWWSPDPRCVLPTGAVHVSRSMKKVLRRLSWRLSLDEDFKGVISQCALPQSIGEQRSDTWITPRMRTVYTTLYRQGRAHSCELWDDDELIGGLYGVCLNQVFCAESMFSKRSNASKIVMIAFCRYLSSLNIRYMDTQFLTAHLQQMGAVEISRKRYLGFLQGNPDIHRGKWNLPADFVERFLRG